MPLIQFVDGATNWIKGISLIAEIMPQCQMECFTVQFLTVQFLISTELIKIYMLESTHQKMVNYNYRFCITCHLLNLNMPWDSVWFVYAGSPSITSFWFDRNTITLICTSTCDPPTTVIWRRNGALVDETSYWQTQIVVDQMTATYKNHIRTYSALMKEAMLVSILLVK